MCELTIWLSLKAKGKPQQHKQKTHKKNMKVRLVIIELQGLYRKNKPYADACVVATMGNQRCTTNTVYKTLNPVFTNADYIFQYVACITCFHCD